jgi:hypothetical protein
MSFPKENGLCITCADKDKCPVAEMLPKWKEILAEHGEDAKDIRPDLWDEYSIDEPDVDDFDDGVMWCAMYYEQLHVKAAAWIRNDGITTTGKSHAEILKKCPFGTCKAGSVSGFIDSNDQFISRERAYKIALEAGQLRLEKIRKRGNYLLSEEIWSDAENGDWAYDENEGYILKETL